MPENQVNSTTTSTPTLTDYERDILLMLYRWEKIGLRTVRKLDEAECEDIPPEARKGTIRECELTERVPMFLLRTSLDFGFEPHFNAALGTLLTMGLVDEEPWWKLHTQGMKCWYTVSPSRTIRTSWNGDDLELYINENKIDCPEFWGKPFQKWADQDQGSFALTADGINLARKYMQPADGQAAGKQQAGGPNTVHPATLAKAILFEQPDIAPTELAKRVGVKRPTLYKTTGPWKDVRAMLIARGRQDAAPSGWKDADGNLEAECDGHADD